MAHPDLPKQSHVKGMLKKIVLRLGRKIMGGDAAKKRGDRNEYDTAFHKLRDDNMNSLWKKLNQKGVKGVMDADDNYSLRYYSPKDPNRDEVRERINPTFNLAGFHHSRRLHHSPPSQ